MTAIDTAKRRKELFERVTKGESLTRVANSLAQKYDVKKRTVKNDWYNRNEWLPELLNLDDTEFLVEDLLSRQELKRKKLWELAENGDNDNVRKGALKELIDLDIKILDILQELGLVEKQADKQELDIKGDSLINFVNDETDDEDNSD